MRIGLDLGGTKTSAIAMARDGTSLAYRRVSSPRGSYEATLDALTGLVTELEAELGDRGSVGLAMPGAISPSSGLVKNSNSTWLIGKPLDRDLAVRLDRPLRVENDANCLALSEATDGAAAGLPSVFGVILGTGVGGGLVVDGQVLQGRDAVAGEWGHNPLPWPADDERPGPLCYCGQRGCIETFLSGPALARQVGLEQGERVVAEAKAGNPQAVAALDRYFDRLARGLAMVINIFDPHAIVIGGGLSNLSDLYRAVPPLLPRYVFSDRADTPLLPAKHGDDSGVRGAACLWPSEDATRQP